MNRGNQYRLIKKSITYIPIGDKLYKKTEILEQAINVPVVELSSTESSPRWPNTPVGCCCQIHRAASPGDSPIYYPPISPETP